MQLFFNGASLQTARDLKFNGEEVYNVYYHASSQYINVWKKTKSVTLKYGNNSQTNTIHASLIQQGIDPTKYNLIGGSATLVGADGGGFNASISAIYTISEANTALSELWASARPNWRGTKTTIPLQKLLNSFNNNSNIQIVKNYDTHGCPGLVSGNTQKAGGGGQGITQTIDGTTYHAQGGKGLDYISWDMVYSPMFGLNLMKNITINSSNGTGGQGGQNGTQQGAQGSGGGSGSSCTSTAGHSTSYLEIELTLEQKD